MSRDKSIVSAAAQLSLPAYSKAPFQQASVDQFLSEFSQHREQAKREADTEKVRGEGEMWPPSASDFLLEVVAPKQSHWSS